MKSKNEWERLKFDAILPDSTSQLKQEIEFSAKKGMILKNSTT